MQAHYELCCSFFFFSSRRRHTRSLCDWSSDVCSSDLATGSDTVHIVLITVTVTPATVTVGQKLVQQFTAVAVPDDAPQTFTWACTPTTSCGNLVQDPNTSGLAVYTAPLTNGPVVVAATSTVQQSSPGVGQAKVQVVTSRLPSGPYAFRFSGYDNSNPPNPLPVAASPNARSQGTITTGVQDQLSPRAFPEHASPSRSHT